MRLKILVVLILIFVNQLFCEGKCLGNLLLNNEVTFYGIFNICNLNDSSIENSKIDLVFSYGIGVQYTCTFLSTRFFNIYSSQTFYNNYFKSSLSLSISPHNILFFLFCWEAFKVTGNDAFAFLSFPCIFFNFFVEFYIGIGTTYLCYERNNNKINEWVLDFPITLSLNLPLYIFNKNLEEKSIKISCIANFTKENPYTEYRIGFSFIF